MSKTPKALLFKGETALLFNIDSNQSEAAITQPEDCHQAATEQEKRPLIPEKRISPFFLLLFPRPENGGDSNKWIGRRLLAAPFGATLVNHGKLEIKKF